MKKKQKRQRKRRKKEMAKKNGKVAALPGGGGPSLQTVQSAEQKIENLNKSLLQLERQENQERAAYATNFVNVFVNIAAEGIKNSSVSTKEAYAEIAEKAIDAAEVIRSASIQYSDQLKKQAPVNPQFDLARQEVLAELDRLSRALGVDTDDGDTVEAEVVATTETTEETTPEPPGPEAA